MMNNPILEKEDYKVILESLPECDTKVKIDTIIKIIELGEQFEKDNIEVRKVLETLNKKEN